MNIGYAKLGRAMRLTSQSWGIVGGDQEPIILLRRLATTFPEHNFHIIGKNSGEDPTSINLPSNVHNPYPSIKSRIVPPQSLRTPQEISRHCDHLYNSFQFYFRDMDAWIIWIGQHGTSNNSIPYVGHNWNDGSDYTKPQSSFVHYCSYLIRGINEIGDRSDGRIEPIYMCTDSRNNLKARDVKWPPQHPILGLYNQELKTKHDRWQDLRSPHMVNFNNAQWVGPEDPGVWYSQTPYVYSGVEVATILPYATRTEPNLSNWEERRPFGIVINEARTYVEPSRRSIMEEWVFPLRPNFIHGEWSDETLNEWKLSIYPVSHREAFDRLATVRCTLTTPSSGSGWATRKPWESFAAGVVCFFHPGYDTQGHIIPTLEHAKNHNNTFEEDGIDIVWLTQWLRCESKEDLWRRVQRLSEDKKTWVALVRYQYKLYQRALRQDLLISNITSRLNNIKSTWEIIKQEQQDVRYA